MASPGDLDEARERNGQRSAFAAPSPVAPARTDNGTQVGLVPEGPPDGPAAGGSEAPFDAEPSSDGAVSADGAASADGAPHFDAERKLRELSFLHEFAKLLTTARNWDELMRTIVDRTTDALDVEVCSVYLMERDSDKMRLATKWGRCRWRSAKA